MSRELTFPRLRPRAQAPASPERTLRRQRRLLWIALAIILLGLPFVFQSGRYVPDTRDAVWFAPGPYVSRSLSAWRASPYLGNEQHEGIIVPMGLFVALVRGGGLSPWLAERLWHGLLLFVAGAGMVLLLDQLRGRRTLAAPLVAALVYALSPYAFGYGIPTTGAFLPYVLLPTLLLVTARWLPRGGLAGPALFGLTTFMMGGGNGAPQVYVLLTILAYLAWVVGVERSVALRRAAWFAGCSAAFFVLLNAYWLFLLTGSEVPNVLAFSEQPKVINVTSSFSETIRGLGFWGFYGGDSFGPWSPVMHRFITSPLLIFTGFAVPVGALASAWLVRWRYRLFFLFLAILSVLVMAGVFPPSSPTPFGHAMSWAFAHFRGVAGLRTTYKFGGTLVLSLAVLVGVGLEEGLARLRSGPLKGWRPVLAGAAAVILVANSFPLWTGQIYSHRSTSGLPEYWRQALAFLAPREQGYRAFFAPGASGSSYRWGKLSDGVAEAFPWLASVHPTRVPVGEHYGSNLLAAIEQAYQAGIGSENAAVLYRYLGVGDVVLQNDIDWQRSRSARPADLQLLARDPSLRPAASFGEPGQNVVAPAPPGSSSSFQDRVEQSLPPVQVLAVPHPQPVVWTDGLPPVVLSGDGFGLAELARRGLLDDQPPILYSGNLDPDSLAALAPDQPAFFITDTNRRRAWSFSSVRRNYSYTLGATQGRAGRSIAYNLFGGRVATQSVAVYQGAATIDASSYGSAFAEEPEFRPSNAFDGDPSTWWLTGVLGNPVGQWVRVNFGRPIVLSRVNVSIPHFPFGRRVSSARLEFSDGTSVVTQVQQDQTTVDFPARQTTFLRVRIISVSPEPVSNGVGFSGIEVPGLSIREEIQLPSDLVDMAHVSPAVRLLLDSRPLTYLFDRARTPSPLVRDEENGIARRFEVATARQFVLRGSGHLVRTTSDQDIDLLLGGPGDIVASSSSRLLGAFRLRASEALDGNPGTAWIPAGAVGQWIKVEFPAQRLDHLTVKTLVAPNRSSIIGVSVAFSDGSSIPATVPENGVMHLSFAPRSTSSVMVRVTRVSPPGPGRTPPVGISELVIPGVHVPSVADDIPLPCLPTGEATMDGQPLGVRPAGTAGQLLSGGNVPVIGCNGLVPLSAGWHDLFFQGAFQPDTLSLASGADAAASATPAPAVTVVVRSGGGYAVDVHGATTPFYLVIGQNYSPAWQAHIGGQSLGAPLLLNGYSAGWRIDRKGSFRITVRYPPQRRYELFLWISGLSVLAALVVGWPLLRRLLHQAGLRPRRSPA